LPILLCVLLGLLLFLLMLSLFRSSWSVVIFLLLFLLLTGPFLVRISLGAFNTYSVRIYFRIYLIAVLAFGCMPQVLRTWHTRFGLLFQDKVLLIFLAYCTLLTLLVLLGEHSHAVDLTIPGKFALACILYFSIISTLRKADHIEKVAFAFIIGGIIVASFSIGDVLLGGAKRGFGIRGENSTGLVCALALPLVVASMKNRRFYKGIAKSVPSMAYVSVILVLMLGVLATGTRGALLAMSVASLLSVSIIGIRKKDAISVGVILLLASVFAIKFGFIQQFEFPFYKFHTFLSSIARFSLPTDMNVLRRAEKLRMGFGILFDHPLFGIGPGVFRATILNDRAIENLYMQLLVNHGILGFAIAFVLGLLSLQTFRRAIRKAKAAGLSDLSNYTAAFAIAYIAMLVFGISTNLLYGVFPWFFLGMAAACFHVSLHGGMIEKSQ